MRRTSLVVAMVVAGWTMASASQAEEETRIGRQIENFKLRDYYGQEVALSDFEAGPLVVVAFLGTECPLVKLYTPRLELLSQQFSARGVTFVGINSNRQDPPTKIANYARKYGASFPILKDPDNRIADAFGAVRTPEVFVLDEDRKVRYWGRIDDQYSVGLSRPKATRNDLGVALDELLASKPVSQPVTEAAGCFIGRVAKVEPRGEVTFSNQIARILNRRCVECHRDGELAPFPLTTFDEVVGWAETIREVVNEGRMPPWFADPRFGHFANDASMSDKERAAINTWVENGSPQGDPAELPEPPKFVAGWGIETPEAVYTMEEPFTVPAEGTVPYQHFLIDPQFEEDVWITDAEARPGNSSVVHHIVLFAISGKMRAMAEELIARERDGEKVFDVEGGEHRGERRDGRRGGLSQGGFGQMVAIYSPGIPPWKYPEGTAMKIRKGSLFLAQMHYTPDGTVQTDQSYVGLRFADAADVRKEIRYGLAVNPALNIPPHESNYEASARVTFRRDTLLLNLFPHMHYRGKSFRFVADYPDGSREVLLDVPRYDFNWQLRYDLAEPKFLPKGTRLHCEASFDNSEDNLINPDPTQTVRFGLQSWEEMLVGYYTHVAADEDLTAEQ